MIDLGINHAIPNRLGDDVFRIFFRIEVELEADIFQGDARVGERDHAKGGLDDVVPQAEDEGVGAVHVEPAGMVGERGLEGF